MMLHDALHYEKYAAVVFRDVENLAKFLVRPDPIRISLVAQRVRINVLVYHTLHIAISHHRTLLKTKGLIELVAQYHKIIKFRDPIPNSFTYSYLVHVKVIYIDHIVFNHIVFTQLLYAKKTLSQFS